MNFEASAEQHTLKYFGGDELAKDVFINKYALRTPDGGILEQTPYAMHMRIAREIIRMEEAFAKNAKVSYQMDFGDVSELLMGFRSLIPAGSSLFGIGKKSYSSLGNCFVVDDVSDSYGGILKLDEELAQIMKRRGGVGLDISHLRPSGAKVSNAASSSTGAVSFMHRFSNTTMEVAQGGRRGALMLSMRISHPDSAKFIVAKDDISKIQGANISLRIDDEFMNAVKEDSKYRLWFGAEIVPVKARELWRTIVHQAWKSAEPGILFWDRIIEESPADQYKDFRTTSTNPCGEVPLCPYDSCRLLSVNVYNCVVNPFTKDAMLDLDMVESLAYYGQRMMDDIVQLESEKILQIMRKLKDDPEPLETKQKEMYLWSKIMTMLQRGRRTGLGLLGLGDMFAAMGIKYDSNEAIAIGEKVAFRLAAGSYKSSIDMAEERGPFPDFKHSIDQKSPYIQRIINECLDKKYLNKYLEYGRRNIANLAIAPTGSLAILAQTTSGIEPAFKVYYTRKRRLDNGSFQEYKVFHHGFKKWYYTNAEGKDAPQLEDLSSSEIDKLIERSPYHKSESHTINPLSKVKMQGRMQKWIDHSISVTHNLPQDATEKTVADLYMSAWEHGCKGVTIYREGSRDGILTTDTKTERNGNIVQTDAPKRPKSLSADVENPTVQGEKWTVIVGKLNGQPYEVFAHKGEFKNVKKVQEAFIVKQRRNIYNLVYKIGDKSYILRNIGHIPDSEEKIKITRLISGSLRHGMPIDFIIEQLNKDGGSIVSFTKAIARVLKTYAKGRMKLTCTNCGSTNVAVQDGCSICLNCGGSSCG